MAEVLKTCTVKVYGMSVYGDFVITNGDEEEVLIAGIFERSKGKVKSVACNFGKYPIYFGYGNVRTVGKEYKIAYYPVRMGRDRFTYSMIISKDIGVKYILTTEEDAKEDFFQFCMKNTKLPLMDKWKDFLFDTAVDVRLCERITSPCRYRITNEDRTIPIHGKQTLIKDIVILKVEACDNGTIGDIISAGLSEGKIRISDSVSWPLNFTDFDSYIKNYGRTMVKNLEDMINPLSPLKGTVNEVAFKHKRLFPQQAACINGIKALRKAGSRYGLMIEGMGCGKTLQGAGVCDAYYNEKWLEENPGKTLRDLYQHDEVKYRNIMMAPSHLVYKWKDEILSEIPNSKVTIIDDLSVLDELKRGGRERKGREWYLISKDTCKLSYQYSPTPSHMVSKREAIMYCAECAAAGKDVPKKGLGNSAYCPDCGGKKFIKKYPDPLSKRGLVCPNCGELLLKYSQDKENDSAFSLSVLQPEDFAQRNDSNSTCYCCGYPLWGSNVKSVDCGGEWSKHVANRKSPWYKISHYKNMRKKDRKTAFVLRGHELSYFLANNIEDVWRDRITGEVKGPFEVSKREYGPRKVAPASYIKKQLKGFFDFCILDECHKYENGGTAQSTAAHSLIEASDFTLCLTGTISNGKADSFFYLLYMLDPRRMNKMGYTHGDVKSFVEKYGTLESVYDAKGKTEYDSARNSNSRGRMLKAPKVLPGISPMLFVDFLFDKAVFLDLSDLSKYIPKLTEEIRLVEVGDSELLESYNSTINTLSSMIREKNGRAALSSMLQFGLSYLDKPYGREDILSPYDGKVMACVENFGEYSNPDRLLSKEKELINIINSEIEEGRNCFVYASYTGEPETNVTERLKSIIEANCNLKDRVQILNASSPEPLKREAWIKKKASEGKKVIICNPKCVETGLDFCFNYEGRFYNYPTLIFYQMSYELSVIWQASRRHYRLNQKEDCRTYYLAYENTATQACLELMADKMAAASAIQGKFSSEGLTAMAKGIDPRVKLAQMMADGDCSDRVTLESMFDAINEANASEADESEYVGIEKALTYFELMGVDEETGVELIDNTDESLSLFNFIGRTEDETPVTITNDEKESEADKPKDEKVVEVEVVYKETNIFEDDFFGFLDEGFAKLLEEGTDTKTTKRTPKKAKIMKGSAEGQINFFDFLSA